MLRIIALTDNYMKTPKFSVIIPAHNGARYLSETIESVLAQSYDNFELLIVDDASSDETPQIIGQFTDPRIKYIRHNKNRGSNPARNTGIRASTGEIVAFLDQDDLFHKDKLKVYAAFSTEHPYVGAMYNSRLEFQSSISEIVGFSRPPLMLTLQDLVIGYPICPSDLMVTREWLERVNLWSENIEFYGGELDFTCRLALAGCQFAGVDRALTYRRYHYRRVFRNLEKNCLAEIRTQERILSDPLCPDNDTALRNTAFLNTYLEWAYTALAQNETELGLKLTNKVFRLKPALFEGVPLGFATYLIERAIVDENQVHEPLIRRIFEQLAARYPQIDDQTDWAVARGYLLNGTQAIMWGRIEIGRELFGQASNQGAKIDDAYIQWLTKQLLDYRSEFGSDATKSLLQTMTPSLELVDGRAAVRWLQGCYSMNLAFNEFAAGNHNHVPQKVFSAIANNPRYIVDRGLLSIFVRSLKGLCAGYDGA